MSAAILYVISDVGVTLVKAFRFLIFIFLLKWYSTGFVNLNGTLLLLFPLPILLWNYGGGMVHWRCCWHISLCNFWFSRIQNYLHTTWRLLLTFFTGFKTGLKYKECLVGLTKVDIKNVGCGWKEKSAELLEAWFFAEYSNVNEKLRH